MAKEEEASTSASSFTCSEDLISIEFRTETLIQNIEVSEVISEHSGEHFHLVESHPHFLFNRHYVIIQGLLLI